MEFRYIKPVLYKFTLLWCCTFQGLLSILALHFSQKSAKELTKEMKINFWSTHGIPGKTKLLIQKGVKLSKMIMLSVLLITPLSGVVAFFKQLLPHWSIFEECSWWHCFTFTSSFLIALLGLALPIYTLAFVCLYWSMHINLQLRILTAYFDTIGENIRVFDTCERRESVTYQIELRRRLIVGIKQHVRLVRYLSRMLVKERELVMSKI